MPESVTYSIPLPVGKIVLIPSSDDFFTPKGSSAPCLTTSAMVRILFLLPNIKSSCYNLISLFSLSFPQGESVLTIILYLDESHLYSALHCTECFKYVISLNFWRLKDLSVISLPSQNSPERWQNLLRVNHLYMTQMDGWVLNPGVCLSHPKLFSWYQEPPSVGKESDTLPGSSLAYDHHVILMYIFSDAIFHSCLRCPYSFLSYMVSMCHINYMVLKYSVLKKKTKKQKLNCGMIRCQGLLPWHTYIHVFCCVAGFVV